ncbi:MAG: phospholipase D-like domain-containing protein [Mariprofundaceae bacterium]
MLIPMPSPSYELNLLLTLLVALHVLYQRRPTQTLIIWLLVVIALPGIGALAYLLFGSRKIFARRPKPLLELADADACALPLPVQRHLQRLCASGGIPPATGGHALDLTTDPAQARAWLIAAIESARHRIHLETYIYRLDATGLDLLERLAARAREGVEVRLLVDAFGSLPAYLNRRAFRPLIEAGGEVAFFQPLGSIWQSRINLRNHRKIYLFDDRVLIAGGINIGREYLDPDPNVSWVDLTFRLQGPSLAMHAQTFAADWHYATGREIPTGDPPPPAGRRIVQAMPSGPDLESDTLREALVCALHRADERIVLVTPYFIPDQPVLEAVLSAARRGVHVRLLTPAETDHRIFDWGRAPYMRELVEVGVEVCCFDQAMLHAKAVIVDDALAMIGSANLDWRSLLINYEFATFCYDPTTLSELSAIFETLAADATPYRPPSGAWPRVRENLVRIVTPAL